MFFRRERPKQLSFTERLENLRRVRFTVDSQPDGAVQVSRNGVGVVLRNVNDMIHVASRAGLVMEGEIGSLVDGGFQKFFRTPSGKKKPALARELKAIHEFEEDLKEGLGLKSLYNESLGTVSTFYLYDRVKDRDRGVPRRIWEQ